MSAPRVVVTDATFPDLGAEERAATAAGATFERHACTTAGDVEAAVAGATVAVVQFAPLSAAAIARLAPGATAIRYGVGFDNFDLSALKAAGVKAAYVPDYCIDEVADHTAAAAIGLMRKLVPLDASVRRGEWGAIAVAKPLQEFSRTTVGFLGFGRIAQAVAARLRPFKMTIIAHDPFAATKADDVPLVDRDTLFRESDCISLHVPLTDQTRHIIDAPALSAMKSTAVLVNSARGDLVEEAALADALHRGAIAGAALDVFAAEPLPAQSPLRSAPNLLLSPHAAWYSDGAVARLQTLVADEITRALSGAPPRQPIPGTMR